MKIKLLTFVLSLMAIGASAQQVTTGQVVDKAGNPISGARVEAKGKVKSYATTGIDGRFSLETPVPIKKVQVSSLKCQTQKVDITPNMTVIMSPETFWNRKPSKFSPFAMLQATVPGPDSKGIPFGVMGGMVKTVGFYGRIMLQSMPSTDDKVDMIKSVDHQTFVDKGNNILLLGDDYKTGYQAFTAGMVLNLGGPMYFTLGAGVWKRKVAVEHVSGKYLEIDNLTHTGPTVEAGLMVKFGSHVLINGGSSCLFGMKTPDHGDDATCFTANFGIGYMF